MRSLPIVLILLASALPTAAVARDRPDATLHPAAQTSSPALRAAVLRIPGYARHRPAQWVVSSRYPSWGVTDWYRNTVYISPSVPPAYLDAVVRHEWSHILSVRAYHGDVAAAVRAMNRRFGGAGATGLRGAEVAADCMARELGARWTHYTACQSWRWRLAARRLLAGHELG